MSVREDIFRFRLVQISFFDRLTWTALTEKRPAMKVHPDQSRRACPELVERGRQKIKLVQIGFFDGSMLMFAWKHNGAEGADDGRRR
jgi:hypothetical protein